MNARDACRRGSDANTPCCILDRLGNVTVSPGYVTGCFCKNLINRAAVSVAARVSGRDASAVPSFHAQSRWKSPRQQLKGKLGRFLSGTEGSEHPYERGPGPRGPKANIVFRQRKKRVAGHSFRDAAAVEPPARTTSEAYYRRMGLLRRGFLEEGFGSSRAPRSVQRRCGPIRAGGANEHNGGWFVCVQPGRKLLERCGDDLCAPPGRANYLLLYAGGFACRRMSARRNSCHTTRGKTSARSAARHPGFRRCCSTRRRWFAQAAARPGLDQHRIGRGCVRCEPSLPEVRGVAPEARLAHGGKCRVPGLAADVLPIQIGRELLDGGYSVHRLKFWSLSSERG